MTTRRWIMGLLDTSAEIADARVAAQARSLSLSWLRFRYFDPVLEDKSVNAILDRALDAGFEHCLILAHGVVVSATRPGQTGDFREALDEWLNKTDFFVAGPSPRALLVDLRHYERLGRPAWGERPGVVPPALAVHPFDPALDDWILDLDPSTPARATALGELLDDGIASFDTAGEGLVWAAKENYFLHSIHVLTRNLRRGVFFWNIESYADIDEPPEAFMPPVSTIYSVTAGFKANRVLETHGFDADTRVVFFDYSPQALELRKWLREEWDGDDYPGFLSSIFDRLMHGKTFFTLFDEVEPDEIEWGDVERGWQRELDRWGGAENFRQHWLRYREIRHEYVLCNVLTQQQRIFEAMADEPSPVIWWSNAFSSVYSNWFHTCAERRRMYSGWIEGLAAAAPRAFLYGSSAENVSVNSVRADAYRQWYRQQGGDELHPRKLHRYEIRF